MIENVEYLHDKEDEGARYLLAMEYGLTIAIRRSNGCECADYFIERRDVLFPVMLDKAKKDGVEVDEVFAEYARKVHARHTEKTETA